MVSCLKPGGKLILFCPDEKEYRKYCDQTGHPYNEFHRQPDFSIVFVKNIFRCIGNVRIIHEVGLIDVYSWELVCEKIDSSLTICGLFYDASYS